MLRNIILVLCLGFVNVSLGQFDIDFYCDVMHNAYEAEHREKAAAEFETLFREELVKDGSFNESFESLKWLSLIHI